MDFSPVYIWTHYLQDDNWRMNFSQRRPESKLYLHFHNKKNFGFRIRIPFFNHSKTIKEIFDRLYNINNFSFSSSEIARTIVNEKIIYVKENSFEESMNIEKNRILNAIGDYRGTKVNLPDNVADFTEYLKEPIRIVPTENLIDSLLTSVG